MELDLWRFEKEARENGFSKIAGIDEAGRGPLAGPVVSAAVILPESFDVLGINDSKMLSPKKRSELFDRINRHALAVGVAVVEAPEIDRMNILQAALFSMETAVQNLKIAPDFLLIDGNRKINSSTLQEAVPKGDSRSISIAAASIIAKVTRDRIMEDYHSVYPEYNFKQHKGYPTKAHRLAIKTYGCCPIHRRSFKGVKEYFDPIGGELC